MPEAPDHHQASLRHLPFSCTDTKGRPRPALRGHAQRMLSLVYVTIFSHVFADQNVASPLPRAGSGVAQQRFAPCPGARRKQGLAD